MPWVLYALGLGLLAAPRAGAEHVAAACEAATQGASVFLLAPRPYLGTDLCATLRLWLEAGEQPKSKLAIACFGTDRVTTPLRVKAAMDRALLGAGAAYLTGCYVTDVLCDQDGRIAGVVMANRSGRQAVRAKVVVDATCQAVVARQAKAAFRPFVPGPQTFRRVVIGGAMRSGDRMSAEKKDVAFNSAPGKADYRLPVDERVNPGSVSWNAVEKAEWLRRELVGSGAEVWFGTLGCGALLEGQQVRGVVVATPQGRGVVLASTVIDATGNSDIAACAHAETQYGISEQGALNVQIAGFPERPLKRSYVNTCYTMVDDTDVLDVWHLMAWKRMALPQASSFDVGQLVDSRERRRVVGDYTLTVQDILNRRTFPDTISQHYSNFDAAAFPDSPLLLACDAKGPCFKTDLPYRCLLPQGLDGILVVGLGASAQRDAMTLTRMQADLQNQGYAAGLAAAMAARARGHTRSIDIKALQKKLIEVGVLDARVYTDRDSYPLSLQRIEQAVEAIGSGDGPRILEAVAVILDHRDAAIPLLRKRFQEARAEDEHRECARILGILGDPAGVAVLSAAVDAHSQSTAWRRRHSNGMPKTSTDIFRAMRGRRWTEESDQNVNATAGFIPVGR